MIGKKKKHENVFKNWLRPNFPLLPPKNGGSKIWGGPAAPLPPPLAPGPYIPRKEIKKVSSSSSNYVVLTFQGEKKIYPFFELVENKPHFLPLPSEVCHAWCTSKPPQAVLLWKISKIKQSLVE